MKKLMLSSGLLQGFLVIPGGFYFLSCIFFSHSHCLPLSFLTCAVSELKFLLLKTETHLAIASEVPQKEHKSDVHLSQATCNMLLSSLNLLRTVSTEESSPQVSSKVLCLFKAPAGCTEAVFSITAALCMAR